MAGWRILKLNGGFVRSENHLFQWSMASSTPCLVCLITGGYQQFQGWFLCPAVFSWRWENHPKKTLWCSFISHDALQRHLWPENEICWHHHTKAAKMEGEAGDWRCFPTNFMLSDMRRHVQHFLHQNDLQGHTATWIGFCVGEDSCWLMFKDAQHVVIGPHVPVNFSWKWRLTQNWKKKSKGSREW